MLCKHYLHKLYHTFTPFRKKGGCITCTGLHKRAAVCTLFIGFPFEIIQLMCIIFFIFFTPPLTKAHGRIHTASYTVVVGHLLDSAARDAFFFFLFPRDRGGSYHVSHVETLDVATISEQFQFKVTLSFCPAGVHTLV